MARVLIVAMPFFSVRYPAVGISLLKPRLKQSGFACDIRYFSIPFAERIGLARYDEVCNTHTQTALVGEWLFAQSHFGPQLPPVPAYLAHLERYFAGSRLRPADLLEMRDLVPGFLEHCLAAVDWDRYDVVGFSTSCEQNLPAIALASRVKARCPEKPIVFGGSNCEGEMGLELHRMFTCIDYVCSGEADHSFPQLVRHLEEGRPTHDLRGVVSRVDGQSHFPGEAAPVRDLDSLPYPDYDDYFAALDASALTRAISAGVPLETSRGCWWGAKHHCTFCGLKDSTMVYRSKSPDRALAEIRYLVERHQAEQLQVVDNILDLAYFKGLIPELKRLQLPVQLFYETKANLTKRQVQSLADAGVTWLQPGIESLNSHVLQLMDKGITGLQNIQLLKWCKQFGIYPTWNLLTGFPGEHDEDYARLLEFMGKVTNLNPPEGFATFALYRFAPYFTQAARYGIQNVRPEKTYHFIYPFPDDVLINLGYYLEFDYAPEVKPSLRYDGALAAAVDEWKRLAARGDRYLYSFSPSPDELCIEDRRAQDYHATFTLTGVQGLIYRFCDSIHSVSAILQQVRGAFPDLPIRRRDVQDFLDDLVALGLMLEENGKYLSIAVSLDVEESADKDAAEEVTGLVTLTGSPHMRRQL